MIYKNHKNKNTKKIICIIILFTILFFKIEFLFSEKKELSIFANKKKYDHKKKYWDFFGNAIIKYGNDRLFANSIKYFNENKKIIAVGNVKLFNEKNSIEVYGNFGEYYLNTKYAKLIKNTKLLIINNDITIYSDYFEYFGNKKLCILKNNVKIFSYKENININCGYAIYKLDSKKIILKNNPKIFHGKDFYSANEIIINVITHEITLKGNAYFKNFKHLVKASIIYYNLKDPNKKAVLLGNPKLEEYSEKKSLLKGKAFRIIKSDKIIYYNTNPEKAFLIGNVLIKEYYSSFKKSKNKKLVRVNLYERRSFCDEIRYIGGKIKKYQFFGNVRIYDPNYSAISGRMDYYESKKLFIFQKNPIIYEHFSNIKNGHLQVSKIKSKAYSKIIHYYSDLKKLILEGDAHLINSRGTIQGDLIEVNNHSDKIKSYIKGNAIYKRNNEYAEADLIHFTVIKDKLKKIVLKGNAYYENDDFQVESDYVEHFQNLNKTILIGNSYLYDDKNNKTLFGEKIVYFKENNIENIFLEGRSWLSYSDNKIWANKINYTNDNSNEILFLNGQVKIEMDDKNIYAQEMIYYNLKKNKKTTKKSSFIYDAKLLLKDDVRIEDHSRIVKSDKGEYYYNDETNKKKGFLTGNCKIIKRHQMEEVYSDSIEYSNINSKEIYSLKNNVEFIDDSKSAYANEIILEVKYQNNVDKFTLIGNPKIENKDSSFTGKKIEIYDGSLDKIKVIGKGIYINTKEEVEMTADLLLYDENRKMLSGSINPILIGKHDNVLVYGKLLEYFYDYSIATVSGDAKIVQDKRIIYGERAKYEENKNLATIEGNAALVEDNNFSRAKKIILNTKKKTIRLIDIKKGQVDTSN